MISRANFVGCHQPQFVNQFDIADELLPHGVLLLNTSTPPEKIWEQLPADARGIGAGGEDGLEKLAVILTHTCVDRVITSI